jgi:L-alanine-DL-glutamate epimerase-like enolase superfamily enzyme
MKLSYTPYTLQLRHTLTLANSSRSSTPAMLVEVEADGIRGYGEAAMPPYLSEDLDSAQRFFSSIDMSRFTVPFDIAKIMQALEHQAPGNPAAGAAVDIALHDWVGKRRGAAWHRIWGLDPAAAPPTSYTIGIDTPEMAAERAREASDYSILKVKLGSDNDREIITAIRRLSNAVIRVDVNQGWTERSEALKRIEWLAVRNVELVEQPMPKHQIDDLAWLRERSPLPIIADEAVQGPSDLAAAAGLYDGINIKLMKCGGMAAAYAMIARARVLGLKVMIGCMTETSCAISAAAQLAPLADWIDLDGALLIANDPFEGVKFIQGRLHFADRPGIGVVKKSP